MIKQVIDFPGHISGDTLKAGALVLTLYNDVPKTVPLNLSGYRVDMQVRQSENPGSRLMLNFSTINGKISISGANNNIIMTEAVPALEMEISPRVYFYDLQITSPAGVVQTIVGGKFPILPQVTKV